MTTALLLFAHTALIYISLMGLGLGLGRPWRRGQGHPFEVVRLSPVIVGLAVVQLVGWYVLQFSDGGVGRVYKVLALASAVSLVIHFIRPRTSVRKEALLLLSEHWVAAVSVILFTLSWWPLVRFGYLTSAGANGDIAAYAQIAQHIQHHGFADIGRVVGADMGTVSRVDATGAYMVLAYAHGIINRPYNGIMLPVLATFVAAVAQQGRSIISRVSAMSPWRSAVVVLVPQSTFMFVYLTANYFLAQIISMAAFFAFVLTCVWARKSVEDGARLGPREVVWASAPPIVLLVTYPHMAFVVLPMAVMALAPIRRWTVFRRYIVFFGGAGLVTGILCFQKLQVGLERFFKLANDTTSGWPLPSLSPAAIFGFQSDANHRADRADVIVSTLIVLTIVVAVGFLMRQRTTSRGLLPLVFIVTTACVLMNVTAADTYRNWKWTTYFIPLIVVVGLWSVSTALRRQIALSRFLLVGLVVLIPLNVSRSRDFMDMIATRTPVVTYEMSRLGSAPELRGLGEINVRTGAYLNSMWPALFLDPLRVRILDPSYYSAPAPIEGPTLIRNNGEIANSRLRIIGDGFALVDYPTGEVTTSTGSFGALIELRNPQSRLPRSKSRTIKVSVHNTGLTTWIGSGSWKGSVNIGARLLDPRTRKPVAEIGRGVIAPFPDYVTPGETRSATVVVSTSVAPGAYLLEVSPVIERISWASELSPMFSSVTPIDVR